MVCSTRLTDSEDVRNPRPARRKAKGQLFLAEKEAVSGVGHSDFLSNVRSVAAGSWRLSTFGVQALDAGGRREHAAAVVADDIDEKPGNGIGVR